MRHIYKKYLFTILVFLLTTSLGLGPVFAQADFYRKFDRPLESGDSSSSFRQSHDQQQRMQMLEQDSIMERGRMMTSPETGLLYQVHVLGEVENPGTYRVLASERLAEVLQRAGGIANQGSRRRVQIRRDNKVVKTVDILKFHLQGKLNHNPYLLDNDVIYAPLKKKSVQVVGAVKRPETYELLSENDVWDVIQLAGGFSTGVDKTEPARLIRFENGKKKVISVNLSKNNLEQFRIKNGDVIYVPNVITSGHEFDYDIAKLPGDNIFYPSYEDRVFVLGGIHAPGAYPFNPYYNIHQYISLAGGYTKMSTRKIHILTPEGKKIRVKKNNGIKINPGDTVMVDERRIPPEGWVSLFMSVAGFGLSTTATVLTLTN